MPAGLLDRLSDREVIDLLTFVEAGGDPGYYRYQRWETQLQPWGDTQLPVTRGLVHWFDASAINRWRSARGEPQLSDNQPLGSWPDSVDSASHAGQRDAAQQPRYRKAAERPYVEFDGADDYLVATQPSRRTRSWTAMLVVRPNHNQDWPGLLSANAPGKNDYQSGMNIDLMHQPRDAFESIMVEGTGYPGVINLMRESHPFGQFFIVTVRSRPGAEGVSLRINGRPQASRKRPDSTIDYSELTVGARYWSNDPQTPPYNRGFFDGAIAQVLFYDRALGESEMVANEVFLWESNRPLLDPDWETAQRTPPSTARDETVSP
jgi:hypothetical protein